MEFVQLVACSDVFIMFSLAPSIKTEAFKDITKNPLSFYRFGLSNDWLTFIGFAIALTIPFPHEVKVGIILITCLPSAVTSNYITKKLNGNVALSISLTAITSVNRFFDYPIYFKDVF